jgi:hypothetical protein
MFWLLGLVLLGRQLLLGLHDLALMWCWLMPSISQEIKPVETALRPERLPNFSTWG